MITSARLLRARGAPTPPMAYSPPQRYITPAGPAVRLPPEVAAGLVGFEPDEPQAPVGQDVLATPPVLPEPEEPTIAEAVGGIARPGFVADLPGATTPAPTPLEIVADVARPDLARALPGATGPAAPAAKPPQPAQLQQRPLTPDDVRAGGYAPVLDEQRAALGLEREAGAQQIAVDKASAEAEAKALAESGAREQAREAERTRIQQETLADIARRGAAIDADIERIASTKIDSSVRRPAIAAIGLAMGALGAALSGKNDGSNPALDIMLKQIDTNVQRQMAERDAAVRAVGLKRDQLAGVRQRLTDTNALYDGLAAAETRRMRTEIARIGASSKSDAAKANLAKLDSMLVGKEAEYLQGAKDRQFAFDDKEKQRREQERANRVSESQRWAGIAEQRADRSDRRYQFEEQMKLKRDELDKDLKVALAKASGDKAKVLADAAQQAKQLGFINPATGEPIVTADGQRLLDEASKLEAQAQKLRAGQSSTGQAQAEKLSERAAELRAEAQTVGAALGRRPEHAEALQQKLSTTQTTLSLIDEIKKDARKAGTAVLNANELENRLGTKLDILALQLNKSYGLGALDADTRGLLESMTGGNPSKLDRRGVLGVLGVGQESGEKTVTKLDSVAKSLEDSALNDLRSVRVKTWSAVDGKGFRFRRDDETDRPEFKAATELLKYDTPVEREEKAPSAFIRGAQKVFYGRTDAPEETGEVGSKKYPGLAPEQERPMDELLAQARQTGAPGKNARAKLIEVATAKAESNPALSNAVLNVLRDQAPDVYREALAGLPEDQRALREASARVGREGEPLGSLEQRAISGEVDAVRELQRRAEADRGGPAAQTWMRVLGEFDRRNRTPGGR